MVSYSNRFHITRTHIYTETNKYDSSRVVFNSSVNQTEGAIISRPVIARIIIYYRYHLLNVSNSD